MHPLVQSAIEAAQQGDKNKAMGFLKQVLTANPNDIEAMLVLAGLVDQPDRKRQILNHVLTLEPANRMAREEMLKLDRMAMRTFRSDTSATAALHRPAVLSSNEDARRKPEPQAPMASDGPAPARPQTQNPSVSKSITQPVNVKNSFTKWNWVEESPTVKHPAAVELDGSLITEKPLVFKYPLFWRFLIYFFVAFFGCVGLLVASQNVVNSLPFLGLALVMGLAAIAFSPKVEVSEAGIRASAMLSDSEIRWDEITSMKSMSMKRRLELSGKDGKVVNVSTQVSGYPSIVEIIRQRRPDLFGGLSPSEAQNKPFAVRYGNPGPTSPFTETKTFKKKFFAQYGIFLPMLPICLVGIWATVANDKFLGIGLGFVSLLFMAMSLFNVNQIKVEPNKLTTESFFSQKELTARQIREISMKTVRSRRGVASNFIRIQPVEGTAIALAGFPEGDEIIYGTLINWWESYRDE